MASSGITPGPDASAAAGCYAAGTPILTDRGEVPIEELEVGDLAVTSTGERRPIRRIGQSVVDCRSQSHRDAVLPVRIAAHAFAPGKPSRDVLVSPALTICVDVLGEVLIPAAVLVNGATVATANADVIRYWHVELDGDDILAAAGLPAGSRAGDLWDAAAGRGGIRRPFHDEGLVVAGVRAQMALRAAALGWVREDGDPVGDLHLVADGRRIDPVRRGSVVRFTLPADVDALHLVSGAAKPSDLGLSADGRLLGIDGEALAVTDGFCAPRAIAIDDPRLSTGFHEVEVPESGSPAHRWTDGRASVPAELLGDCRDGAYLAVTLSWRALPRWIARTAASADTAPR